MHPTSDDKALVDKAARCWFLTGATASGKTKVSLKLAELLNAEIISLDSMAIYRGMDIGTAKPSQEAQERIPHHLLDIVDPTEVYSVSQYREAALACVDEIRGRGKEVMFVGGTALYLKALLRGMFQGPPADWDFRNQIQGEISEMGAQFLHQRLEMVDPVSAYNLHPNDHRRIIRALEVHKITGKPISHWQLQFDEGRMAEQCRVFSLRHEREILHRRIESRVQQMFADGLIDEVAGLLQTYGKLGKTASQAVGYCEVIAHLKEGVPLDETIEKVRVRTRRFARHQETWFRGLSEVEMVDLPVDFQPDEIAARLLEAGRSRL